MRTLFTAKCCGYRVSVVPAGPSAPLDLWRDSTLTQLGNWSLSRSRTSWIALVSRLANDGATKISSAVF